ncbi:hypothetical protein DIPPA_19514 [Diplonema papillatum]|nr:hypothetical protein DIPPA_19514 [Diplonema papillatum]
MRIRVGPDKDVQHALVEALDYNSLFGRPGDVRDGDTPGKPAADNGPSERPRFVGDRLAKTLPDFRKVLTQRMPRRPVLRADKQRRGERRPATQPAVEVDCLPAPGGKPSNRLPALLPPPQTAFAAYVEQNVGRIRKDFAALVTLISPVLAPPRQFSIGLHHIDLQWLVDKSPVPCWLNLKTMSEDELSAAHTPQPAKATGKRDKSYPSPSGGTVLLNSPRSVLVLLRRGVRPEELQRQPAPAAHPPRRCDCHLERKRKALLAELRAEYDHLCRLVPRAGVLDFYRAYDPSRPAAVPPLALAAAADVPFPFDHPPPCARSQPPKARPAPAACPSAASGVGDAPENKGRKGRGGAAQVGELPEGGPAKAADERGKRGREREDCEELEEGRKDADRAGIEGESDRDAALVTEESTGREPEGCARELEEGRKDADRAKFEAESDRDGTTQVDEQPERQPAQAAEESIHRGRESEDCEELEEGRNDPDRAGVEDESMARREELNEREDGGNEGMETTEEPDDPKPGAASEETAALQASGTREGETEDWEELDQRNDPDRAEIEDESRAQSEDPNESEDIAREGMAERMEPPEDETNDPEASAPSEATASLRERDEDDRSDEDTTAPPPRKDPPGTGQPASERPSDRNQTAGSPAAADLLSPPAGLLTATSGGAGEPGAAHAYSTGAVRLAASMRRAQQEARDPSFADVRRERMVKNMDLRPVLDKLKTTRIRLDSVLQRETHRKFDTICNRQVREMEKLDRQTERQRKLQARDRDRSDARDYRQMHFEAKMHRRRQQAAAAQKEQDKAVSDKLEKEAARKSEKLATAAGLAFARRRRRAERDARLQARLRHLGETEDNTVAARLLKIAATEHECAQAQRRKDALAAALVAAGSERDRRQREKRASVVAFLENQQLGAEASHNARMARVLDRLGAFEAEKRLNFDEKAAAEKRAERVRRAQLEAAADGRREEQLEASRRSASREARWEQWKASVVKQRDEASHCKRLRVGERMENVERVELEKLSLHSDTQAKLDRIDSLKVRNDIVQDTTRRSRERMRIEKDCRVKAINDIAVNAEKFFYQKTCRNGL